LWGLLLLQNSLSYLVKNLSKLQGAFIPNHNCLNLDKENFLVIKQNTIMGKGEFEIKERHYRNVKNFVSHSSHDVTEDAMRKRSNSIAFLQKNLDERPKKPRLVGSADGKLKKILFTIPKDIKREDGKPIWNIYQDIFKKLPVHTHIVLVIQEQSVEFVKNWIKTKKFENRSTIISMPKYINITVWAEDPYLIAEDEDSGEKYFIEPHSFPRWEDGFIAFIAAQELGYKRVKLPLYFEGGNILIGDDFFLMGADYPLESLNQTIKMIKPKEEESEIDMLTRVYNEYLDRSRKIIYVGSTLPVPSNKTTEIEINGEKWEEKLFQNNEGGTLQPLFHIDMFITLAGRGENGKYRVVVGDPRLAAQILELDIEEYAMPELFDDIAQGMEANGFEVIRLPLPVVYFDDREKKERSWYFTTYNNCLVEIISQNEKTIWLPTYGYGNWEVLKKTDDYAKAVYEGLGFKVIMLTDYHPLAAGMGSLHCIKKYLEREEVG
jgi:hypothetical protein